MGTIEGQGVRVPSTRERLLSRDLAVKVFVAGATYVVLEPFTKLGAIVGVMLAPVVSDLVKDCIERHRWSTRRLRRRSAAVLALGREEDAYAERRRPGGAPGGGLPGSLLASAVAVAVVAGAVSMANATGDRRPNAAGGGTSSHRGHHTPDRLGSLRADTPAGHAPSTNRAAGPGGGEPERPGGPPPPQSPIPPAPTGLQSLGPGASPPSLAWLPVTRADHYTVYRDGRPVSDVETPRFDDASDLPAGAYSYQVTAWDGERESRLSQAVSVTYAPGLPAPVLAGTSPTTHPPRFGWTEVQGAAFYVVYRDGIEIGRTSNLAWADTAAEFGMRSYTVRAADASGNQVELSDPLTIEYDAPVIP